MTKKIKKTLYLPEWLVEILDREAELYDGSGTVASTAIYALCELPVDKRATA